MHGQPLRTRPMVYGTTFEPTLSERQAMVLRALVSTYVERAGPVASQVLAVQMPVPLSSASIRNTLAELQEAGLVEKAHASSGRVPTPLGLRTFIDHLLEPADVGPDDQRQLDRALARGRHVRDPPARGPGPVGSNAAAGLRRTAPGRAAAAANGASGARGYGGGCLPCSSPRTAA
jgi:hypothetical protein